MCIFDGDKALRDEAETALVIQDDKENGNNRFLILHGDHRENYKGKPLSQCIAYFQSHQDRRLYWSDDVK
jgi:hypothetical protein